MHGTLTTKFVELLQHYNDIQTDYDNKYRERLKREYKIGISLLLQILCKLTLTSSPVKPDLTEDAINEAIETGETSAFQGEMADRKVPASALFEKSFHPVPCLCLAAAVDRY